MKERRNKKMNNQKTIENLNVRKDFTLEEKFENCKYAIENYQKKYDETKEVEYLYSALGCLNLYDELIEEFKEKNDWANSPWDREY